MEIIKSVCLVIFGLGSGVVVAGAVFSFIAIIGVVPRLAQKTNTEEHIKFYEEFIIFGGIFGASTVLIDYYLPVGNIIAMAYGLLTGIFIGALAMSLAEILNVMPILTRRSKAEKGVFFFVLAIALGKLTGSLLYFTVPGFFKVV